MTPNITALYEALRDDPFYHALESCFADIAEGRAAMLRYYDLSVQEAERWGRVGQSGVVAGLSIWSVPLSAKDARQRAREKAEAMQQAMGADCAALYQQICASMDKKEAQLGLGNMWYLSILGVSPEHQGQGLGRTLLDPVLDKADKAGVASYLTTFTPRNIPFYERQGYVQAATFLEPVTGSAFTVLVRQPNGG